MQAAWTQQAHCPQGGSTTKTTKRSKSIRRPPVVEVPWVPNFELEAKAPEPWGKVESVVELDKTSAEFAEQRSKFLSSFNGRKVEIYSIKRLQHPVKQMQYQLERKSMAMRDRCPVESIVEKTLFHGTSMEAVESINKYGFNRSYGAVQAYGNGVYFARDATLSADTMYAKPDRNGHQMVYIAKVLTGHSTVGVSGMKFPPQRKPGILFDSMVNSTWNPTIYVSGHNDNQIYAEYLVEFKQAKLPAKPKASGHIYIKNKTRVRTDIWWMGPSGPRKTATMKPNSSASITCYGTNQIFTVVNWQGGAFPSSAPRFTFKGGASATFLNVEYNGNTCIVN